MGVTLLESGHNKAQRAMCCVCRSEAVTAALQLQAVRSGAGDETRAHLQQQLAEVEAQKQQSQADLTQAEQRLHQLQVTQSSCCVQIAGVHEWCLPVPTSILLVLSHSAMCIIQ